MKPKFLTAVSAWNLINESVKLLTTVIILIGNVDSLFFVYFIYELCCASVFFLLVIVYRPTLKVTKGTYSITKNKNT